MKKGRSKFQTNRTRELSLGDRIGICAAGIFIITAPFNFALSLVPLIIFIVLCFTAPFLPGFSFFLPIVSRGSTEKNGVAVTFDDGPDPRSTPSLLDLLSKYNVSATFYVNGFRAEANPDLIARMIAEGHSIGNHSYSHDNLIMCKSSTALKDEIEKTQKILKRLNVYPLTFRPPVGVTNPKLGAVLKGLGMYTVNFSRRAGDFGNRRMGRLSQKILARLRSGDIIMLHDIAPGNSVSVEAWLKEVELVLIGIRKKRLKILPLEGLIDRPVMASPVFEEQL